MAYDRGGARTVCVPVPVPGAGQTSRRTAQLERFGVVSVVTHGRSLSYAKKALVHVTNASINGFSLLQHALAIEIL